MMEEQKQEEVKQEPTVEDKLKNSELKVKELTTEVETLEKKYALAAQLAINGYTLMVEVGHTSVQNGSALQEFTMNNKNVYASLLGEFMAKQQQQKQATNKVAQ